LSEAIGKNIDERLRPTDKSKIIINWIIPEVSIGSGGHNVIFTMVRFLEKFGHHNRIYLFGKSEHGSSGELKNVIGDNFKTTIAINDIKKPKIICYGRPVTPRRCFELIVHSLKELHKRGLDFDLSFFGWDLAPYSMPFKFRNLRILAPEDLAKLYNWADLGVVFSPTNCSLLPHEMMACKLPVLELKGPTTEAIFKDGYNITLAEPNPISIADNIDYLLRNPDKRREIAENAYEYVRQFSWEKSAKKVEAILKKELT
ncbi:MAG: glycosyltransferase family 4 protein, partial [Desulfobaccales bacterium]